MKKATLQSESDNFGDSIQFLSGKGEDASLKVAIVGGGKACFDLLQILDKNRLSRLNMKILGVSDKNSDAPGFRYAKEQQLFTTTTLPDLFTLKGLNLIIELTDSTSSIIYQPLPEDDPKVRQPDITKAKATLGWEPSVPVREGLQKTVEWFMQNHLARHEVS